MTRKRKLTGHFRAYTTPVKIEGVPAHGQVLRRRNCGAPEPRMGLRPGGVTALDADCGDVAQPSKQKVYRSACFQLVVHNATLMTR